MLLWLRRKISARNFGRIVKSGIFICISCVREYILSLKASEPVQFQRPCIRSITFDSSSASRSRIALCLRMTNPTSWQVKTWSLIFSFPQSHRRGRSLIVQPYLKRIASLNSSLMKYIPCCLDGNNISHVEVPFACSSIKCLSVFSAAFSSTS